MSDQNTFEDNELENNLFEESYPEEEYEIVDESDEERLYELEDQKEAEEQTSLVPYDPLKRYLLEISRYPLLSKEEEQKLAQAFKEKHDLGAAYLLVVSNLRLVVKIAMEYQKTWRTDLMDLIQEGNIGLVQAVKKFDPLKGIRLSYYASFWIKEY
ncbi:MAG: RNA polymerase subunit sigma-70, partial [Desulfobacterota bacterium]|nr:RNA polymerase subunit sigma-70 [Thermodesulfobacteriota bacterium]